MQLLISKFQIQNFLPYTCKLNFFTKIVNFLTPGARRSCTKAIGHSENVDNAFLKTAKIKYRLNDIY